MKTSEYIEDKINKLPKGYVFTYMDFMNGVNGREAIIKNLNRMAASGRVNKLSKGKYYKPKETVFDTLLPDQYQIVKDLLEENGKPVGYITGYSVYNSLGLTTQISNTIQIGKREIRPSIKRGRFRISFIKQKNTINKENVPLLRLLDAMRYIKKIPDTTIDKSSIRFIALLRELKTDEKIQIVKLAYKYSPATRALLGALLVSVVGVKEEFIRNLKDSLNPITVYNLRISEKVLPNVKNWNIK